MPRAPTSSDPREKSNQKLFSIDEYFEIEEEHRCEYIDGRIEELPMPTVRHQDILLYLYRILFSFVTDRKLGKVQVCGLRIRLAEKEFREPDIVFMSTRHKDRMTNTFWSGADLVMEVVSEDDRRRDLVTKRAVYARAGIPEYWIVDPRDARITVLKLAGDIYDVHGEFQRGQIATSNLLPGFEVNVTAALSAE